ncbi:MAG: hypothetical protein JSS86_02035 [Cyanobacteria bacterium SZAS LIN-2]|nr:hypothetical protein [Cyanobacteria bacterium SZAS LIN-2]MBS2006262.1 hypothetical protein [Cyanobacteria bacterium SZAS TMP-1]
MSQIVSQSNGSPVQLDRNKAIIWARYLIDSHDWLIFATRVTRTNAETGPLTSPIKLLSLSLLTPSGKIVYETMLKPQEMIPAGLLNEHGLDYSVVFNAQPFSDIVVNLGRLISGKQILAWDLNAQQALFDQLCTQFAQPPLPFAGYSLRPEYARFVGEFDANMGNYKPQTLTVDGPSATAECRAMLNTLTTMASTSQTRDTAATGHQGWTAELYKPKVNAKDKIKDFLGL